MGCRWSKSYDRDLCVKYPDGDGFDIEYYFDEGKIWKTIDEAAPYAVTKLTLECFPAGVQILQDQTGHGGSVSKENLALISLLVSRAGILIQECSSKQDGKGLEVDDAIPDVHLVLNMDINKTVLMADAISGKTQSTVVNMEIACVAWGVDQDDKWVLATQELSARRPTQGALSILEGDHFRHFNSSAPTQGDAVSEKCITYADWVERKHPGGENKKLRQKIIGAFSDDGQPGEVFSAEMQRYVSALKRPDGAFHILLPSFFELLVTLKRCKRSFTVVFRTFGEDLPAVIGDLNDFCEGKNALFPGVKMDGSDGDPDYRVKVEDPEKYGTWHRDEAGELSVVMGTSEQAGEGQYKEVKEKSLAFYKDFPGLQIVSGMEAVTSFWWEKCASPGTLAMRDHHAYWRSKKMTAPGGKLFLFDFPCPANRHDLFFDDNIRPEDFYIINPCSISLPDSKSMPLTLLQSHICRALPLEAILRQDYFVKELARLEEGRRRRLFVRKRSCKILRRCKRKNCIVQTMSHCVSVSGPTTEVDHFKSLRTKMGKSSEYVLSREDLRMTQTPTQV